MSSPSIGKPPARVRPPSSFQGGLRRIIYIEQPQPSFEDVSPTHPLTEAEFEARAGVDVTLPEGAKIIGVTTSPQGYSLSYEYTQPGQPQLMIEYKGEWINREQFLEGLGTKYNYLDLGTIAQGAPQFLDPSYVVPQQEPISDWILRTKGQGPKLLYRQLSEGRAKPEWLGLPPEATVTKVESIPEGLQLSYTMPQPQPEQQVSQVLAPSMAPFLKETILGLAQWWSNLPSASEIGKDMTSGRAVPITTEEVLAASMFAASVAAPIIRQKIWRSQPKYTVWEDVGMEQAYASMDIEAPTEIMTYRIEQFARSHYFGKGTQVTPMSRTLELARGGLIQEAEQVLIAEPIIEPSLRTYLPRLQTYATIPERTMPFLISSFLFQPTKPTQPQTPKQITTTLAISGVATSLKQSLFPSTMTQLETRQATLQTQQTRQLQRQLQMTGQLQTFMQIQQQTFLDDLFPKTRKRKGKQPIFDLFGRYKRVYPVMTGQQVMRIRKVDWL